jgi:hypothetical protein
VGPRAGLDVMEKTQILPCRESKPGRPARRYTDLANRLLNFLRETDLYSFMKKCPVFMNLEHSLPLSKSVAVRVYTEFCLSWARGYVEIAGSSRNAGDCV